MQKNLSVKPNTYTKQLCIHCGAVCDNQAVIHEGEYFCCQGCVIAHAETQSCLRPVSIAGSYAILDDPEVLKGLLLFQSEELCILKLELPNIYCAACLDTIESLSNTIPGVLLLEVNYLRKDVLIKYNPKLIRLSAIAEALSKIGYPPLINLNSLNAGKNTSKDYSLLYQLGVAGFGFGNIMLFSMPEYLATEPLDPFFSRLFSYLSLFFALPVFFYSALPYFRAAWGGLVQRKLVLDVPLVLGLITVWLQSMYEVISHTGPGYFDSLTGLIFFLLIGRYFQQRTYNFLSFDRDYRSYFPLSVQLVKPGVPETEIPQLVTKLAVNDVIRLRNGEIIPCDARLLSEKALIDYSFVTGEAEPISCKGGQQLFAGGKLVGASALLEVQKTVSQSYLTELWHKTKPPAKNSRLLALSNQMGKFFTYGILGTALFTGLLWWYISPARAFWAFTSVLIIACPCGQALAAPFALGHVLRIFGQHKFYLRDAQVVESLAVTDSWVFDKTGTLTTAQPKAQFHVIRPDVVSETDMKAIIQLAAQSAHPLSRTIVYSSSSEKKEDEKYIITDFVETAGLGIEATINNKQYRIGNAVFVCVPPEWRNNNESPRVYVSIDKEAVGYYEIGQELRPGVAELLKTLGKNYDLYLISGDNQIHQSFFERYFHEGNHMKFNQLPNEKAAFLSGLIAKGHKPAMLGDGVNDAAALETAHMGIAVTDNTAAFTPAADAILDGTMLYKLNGFVNVAKAAIQIIKQSYIISLIYNLIGIGFAVAGMVTPLLAAILMPISSIFAVVFVSLRTYQVSKYHLKE